MIPAATAPDGLHTRQRPPPPPAPRSSRVSTGLSELVTARGVVARAPGASALAVTLPASLPAVKGAEVTAHAARSPEPLATLHLPLHPDLAKRPWHRQATQLGSGLIIFKDTRSQEGEKTHVVLRSQVGKEVTK